MCVCVCAWLTFFCVSEFFFEVSLFPPPFSVLGDRVATGTISVRTVLISIVDRRYSATWPSHPSDLTMLLWWLPANNGRGKLPGIIFSRAPQPSGHLTPSDFMGGRPCCWSGGPKLRFYQTFVSFPSFSGQRSTISHCHIISYHLVCLSQQIAAKWITVQAKKVTKSRQFISAVQLVIVQAWKLKSQEANKPA